MPIEPKPGNVPQKEPQTPKPEAKGYPKLPTFDQFLANPNNYPESIYRELAEALIASGSTLTLASHLDKFHGLTPAIADQIIAKGAGGNIIYHMDAFHGLDEASLVDKLIKHGDAHSIASSLEKYPSVDHAALAERLISENIGEILVKNLDKFHGLDHSQIAHELIAAGKGGIVAGHLEKFDGLNAQVAQELADSGYGYTITKHLNKFHGVDHNQFAHKLINAGEEFAVSSRLDQFHGLDHEIANQLIDYGESYEVAKNLDKFESIDANVLEHLAHKYSLEVAQKFRPEFGSLGVNVLADEAIHSDDVADAIVENITNFAVHDRYQLLMAATTHYSTAQKIKQLNLMVDLGLNIDEADELQAKIAVIKPELKGVKATNPYADHVHAVERISSQSESINQAAVLAGRLTDLLKNPSSAEPRLAQEIERINAIIQTNYDQLRSALEKHYSKEQATALLDGRSGELPPLWATYRRLVAEWVMLMDSHFGFDMLGALATIPSQELIGVLAEANSKFLQVLDVDTEYYDHLYREWDHKREGSLDFEEVFLGRDGVYAYVGRVGQVLARRAAVRLRGQSLSDTEAQLLQMPTYLVYPRGFRDHLEGDVKDIYLRQKLRNPSNASYYDTGFTGTIPQDIMNILGIPRSDWDSKIRLLSASDRVRVITGLKGTKSERDEVVNAVEYNVKPENSAEGLYAQQLPHQEEARLLPYAEPTHPSERIAFRLVQQALYRHYYLQESDRLSKEEHILGVADRQLTRADGGQIHLRLDQSLDASSIQTLRDLFGSTELGSELQNNAQAIKIAGPNDPFPNEAVYELSLATNSGTRDVIIKAIVPEKSNGPLDEYAALRLLDTLGIPSAKPLARVFLPEDESAGFVVMDKLPGESGRLLEKKLQDRQIPPEKIGVLIRQAETMMQEIALRVRNDVGLDKPWRLKDFMVVFNYDDNGQPAAVEELIPIDFERVHVYNPDNPDEVKA